MTDIITLEFYEVLMAAQVGIGRNVRAIRRGSKDRYHNQNNVWARHIEGACAELAFAKWACWHWGGSIDTFENDLRDVGGCEVRVTTHRPPKVRVRPRDPDDLIVVGVYGAAPQFTMIGWTRARVAKQKGERKDTGGGPEYFLLPAGDCEPMQDLRAILESRRNGA